MKGHVENKHQTEFKFKECDVVTKNKVLRRRHMKSAHDKKKCENCHFDAESGSALKTNIASPNMELYQAQWVSCLQMNARLRRMWKLKSLLILKDLQRKKEKTNLIT